MRNKRSRKRDSYALNITLDTNDRKALEELSALERLSMADAVRRAIRARHKDLLKEQLRQAS